MKIVKERIPPFAMGLAIGTVLSIFLLTAWWGSKKKNSGGLASAAVHHILASADSWLNSDRPLTQDDLRGRVLVLHFWSRNCIECVESAAAISQIEAENQGKLSVIGIFSPKLDAEKERQVAASLLHRRGLRQLTALDKDFRVWREFSVRDWPTTMLIDPLGHIFARYSGKIDLRKFRGDLERLLSTFPKPRVDPPLPYRFIVGPESELASVMRFPAKVSGENGVLWVADSANHRVLGMDEYSGKILHVIGEGIPGLKDGDFRQARFRYPRGILAHKGRIFVSDTGNHALRRIDLGRRQVVRVAGTGVRGLWSEFQRGKALETPLDTPLDLALAPAGKNIYVSMAGPHQIWSFDPDRGELARAWGNGKEGSEDGPNPMVEFMQPTGMVAVGKEFYLTDAIANSLRRIGKDGAVKTLIGGELSSFGFSDGGIDRGTMQSPEAVGQELGGLVLADALNHAIRFYDSEKRSLSTLVGGQGPGHADGSFAEARLFEPSGIYSHGGKVFIADSGNHAIRVMNRRGRRLSTLPVAFAGSELRTPDYSRFPAKVDPALALAAREPFTACLSVPEGWQLSKIAPSWLALAREKSTSLEPILSSLQILTLVDQKKLVLGDVSFPPLEEGPAYHLLASIYICRGEGEENECAYDNRRIPLQASSGLGKPGKCAVKINF